jgi:ABC-type arginine transport system permease subunit
MLSSSARYYGSNWLGLKDRAAFVVRSVDYTPLMAGVVALVLMLGALLATWFRESR